MGEGSRARCPQPGVEPQRSAGGATAAERGARRLGRRSTGSRGLARRRSAFTGAVTRLRGSEAEMLSAHWLPGQI